MARKVRHSSLESRTARLKFDIQGKPYKGPNLARGITLLYRRNRTSGSWVLKASDGHGKFWTKVIGLADDYDESDGAKVLTFYEAQDIAKQLARGGGGEADTTAPITVERAFAEYKSDLLSRGARPYNAEYPLRHLTPTLLSKPVQLLTSRELKAWRDSLLGKLAPASINRLCNSFCAALELAAQHDARIQTRPWESGLAGLPDAQRARNIVLSDPQIHSLVAEGYLKSYQLGIFLELLAVTGARPSQATRLRVEDFHDHATAPKLSMPRSGKGGGRNRSARKTARYSVPVTVALANKLKAAVVGRAPDAPLLLQADGSSWGDDASQRYRRDVREVLGAIDGGPEVSLYSLRHSNIVRMLKRNIPVRLIAALHDTSIGQIEKNYSAHITEHDTDALSRAALLSEPAPAAESNVVPLVR